MWHLVYQIGSAGEFSHPLSSRVARSFICFASFSESCVSRVSDLEIVASELVDLHLFDLIPSHLNLHEMAFDRFE